MSGKILYNGPQGICPTDGVRAVWENIMGLSWPIGGPVRVPLSPSMVLRPASDGRFYVLHKEDGSWRCACQGFYYKHTCRHSKAEEEYEAIHAPSELIPRGGFRPVFLEAL